MKYAFTTFSCPELNLDELLALAQGLGYDAIEPRLASGHRHGVELETTRSERARLRRAVAAAGIGLCCLGASCRYAHTDRSILDRQIAETRRGIDLAADIGAPRLRVFGGQIPAGLDRAQARDQIVAGLAGVADHAERQGVTVCLETHDDWSDPAAVVDIMRRVAHPAIAVVWDVMHTRRGGRATMDEALGLLAPWVQHVHIHDGTTRLDRLEFKPIGTGEFDHRRVLGLLAAAGYAGYLSGEWLDWEPGTTHLPRELATMRRYEAGPAAGTGEATA